MPPEETKEPTETPPEEATASSDQTAQMAGNEPLVTEPEVEPIETEASTPSEATPPGEIRSSNNSTQDNLALAQQARQNKRQAKLDKIMTLFDAKPKITNDQVQMLVHVSDATATRYLDILEKEGKVKQVGKTGKAVWYAKV